MLPSLNKNSWMETALKQIIITECSSQMSSQSTILHQQLLLRHHKRIVVLLWWCKKNDGARALYITSLPLKFPAQQPKIQQWWKIDKLFFNEGYDNDSNLPYFDEVADISNDPHEDFTTSISTTNLTELNIFEANEWQMWLQIHWMSISWNKSWRSKASWCQERKVSKDLLIL